MAEENISQKTNLHYEKNSAGSYYNDLLIF